MEIDRGQRAIAGVERAGVFRELDVVALVPAGLLEGLHQRLARRIEVGFEPAPAVIAAQGFSALYQADAKFGALLVERERDQPACQAAADNRNIVRLIMG